MVTVFLPKLAESLKVRVKVKQQFVRDRTAASQASNTELVAYEELLKHSYKSTQKALAQDRARFTKVTEKEFVRVNNTSFTPANEAYLHAVAETILAEYVGRELSRSELCDAETNR